MKSVERRINPDTREEEGIASRIFDNSDFGYYKATIERPKRLKAQFSVEKIETLRFDKNLREPMSWAFETWGEKVYTDLAKCEKELLEWCDKQELNLNTKQKKTLTSIDTWNKQLELMHSATALMKVIGS